MTTIHNYTTRQAASIGLQPGNLIGETHYITESQITPPIKQRVRSRKLLSTNISRCQCCCPPIASSLCRSCLCPCWAYLLIGLLLTLLLAALAVEIGLLTREKIIYRRVVCNNIYNSSYIIDRNDNDTVTVYTSTSEPCGNRPDGAILDSGSSVWSSFTYIFLLINFIAYLINY
ncbi:unnamed protein product [Adineta ricciae]|uniref:Uncharacterized protein n=1 Tax=Adineta ricciae TaxID=249248 RepID=A0A815Z192_ADIRI|nr:unnamed protein product [Adineta ricciae]CAF1578635.1 unnamed protein product [Adineta ricciae]